MKRMLLVPSILLTALLVGLFYQADLSAGPAPATVWASPAHADLLSSAAISGTIYLPTISNGLEQDGGSSPPSPSGDDLSAQERYAVIEAIQTRLEAVLPPANTPVEERNLLEEVEKLGDDLLSVPGVIATVVQTQTLTVHAILSDGLPVTIINNRPPQSTLPEPASALLPAAVDATGMSAVPGSDRAVVANFDGGASVAASVRSQLSQAGYDVLNVGASINAMRNYKNLGALYLDTHGASFLQVKSIIEREDGSKKPELGDSVFALQTSTDVSAAVLENLLGELSNGSVVVAFSEADSGWKAKLAITEKFIATNWTFDDGIVMIHACFAGSGPFNPGSDCSGNCVAGESGVFDPTPLRQAMLAAGAQVVVSYDNYTNANFAKPSILYFFDRLLGANMEEPQNPPLRPFDWQTVRSSMSGKGLLSFTKPAYTFFGVGIGGSSVNLTFDGGGDGGPLAPSIQYFDVIDDVSEQQGKLEVHGQFGDKKGTAEVDGKVASIVSWTQEKVTIRTPYSGPGAAGDLILKSPGKVESNAAPVTEWRGTIKLTQDPNEGSLQAQAEMDIRFRADVHSYRESIDAAPKQRLVESYVSPASEGSSSASGFVVGEDGTRLTWSGGDTFSIYPKFLVDTFAQTTVPGANSLGAAQSSSSSYGGIVTLDPAQNKASICLTLVGFYDTEVSSAPGKAPGLITLMVPDLVDRMRGTLGCIDVSLTPDFSIPSGSRTASIEQAQFKLEWTKFEPVSAPNDQTPG